MATLQKFKFLATQCAVIGSPTRSPTTSPVIHLRRRKTLRMLLGRTSSSNSNNNRRFHRRDTSSDSDKTSTSEINTSSNDQICSRHKLKDLFVSSPPPIPEKSNKMESEEAQRLIQPDRPSGGALVVSGRIGGAGMRPLSATLRQRLLRRAWRPVLVAIPEQSP